jgi:hypothetical protein
MKPIFDWFSGRTTFFAFWFFVVGIVLAFMGKLTTQYIALAGGLQTILTLRAISEDNKEVKTQASAGE